MFLALTPSVKRASVYPQKIVHFTPPPSPTPWRLRYSFAGFFWISPRFGPNSGFRCYVFLDFTEKYLGDILLEYLGDILLEYLGDILLYFLVWAHLQSLLWTIEPNNRDSQTPSISWWAFVVEFLNMIPKTVLWLHMLQKSQEKMLKIIFQQK